MQKVFDRFKDLFEKRYSLISVTNMGEDSVRYDFYQALQEIKNIEPWKMQLEYPMNEDSFIPRKNAKMKRKEKPKVDLWVAENDLKLSVEFGFFRKSSNPKSSTAITENTFKMLNDYMRLGIQSYLTKSDSYFVCVSDSKMIGHQIETKKLDKFPASSYSFNFDSLHSLVSDYKSGHKIDNRFLEKFKELELNVKADLIYESTLVSRENDLPTKLLIWKVFANIYYQNNL
jgi:hypothetical protein